MFLMDKLPTSEELGDVQEMIKSSATLIQEMAETFEIMAEDCEYAHTRWPRGCKKRAGGVCLAVKCPLGRKE